MEIERFFSDLGKRIDSVRENNERRYQVFFDGLKPRLKAASDLERELNRHLAHRFNVLDYLRTDELGLSRIIADLLHPNARHGQGPLFLNILLDRLGLTERWPGAQLADASVSPERVITAQRRIDVYVRIPGRDGPYCLAIENKPYAEDQENQVNDYLEHLAREFRERFVLIYLSPTGEGPLHWSLPKEALEQWVGHLIIMGYHDQGGIEAKTNEDDAADPYQSYRASFPFTEWISDCHDKCRVERLRWFLRDAHTFCRRKFGDHHMTTDGEARAVTEFLLSNPDNLAVARSVYESWPAVRDQVCRQFLEHLRSCIERGMNQAMPDVAHDVEINCGYDGEKRESTCLRLYRTSWKRYGMEGSGTESSRGRTYIFLGAERGVAGWYMGVCSPLSAKNMTEVEKARRSRLDERLGIELGLGQRTDWCPQWVYVDGRMRNWNELVPELLEECETAGEITTYFTEVVLDIAAKAIPIIDEIESSQH